MRVQKFEGVFSVVRTNLRYCLNTEYTQKNGAVSEVNMTFISHLTRTQRTPSAAAVSHALITILQTITADMLHRVWDEFDYRVDVCRWTQGAHYEGM
jgi:hypothetical protein